jgi:hypothetical protein
MKTINMKNQFIKLDEPGNAICMAIGFDTNNNVVAEKYGCDIKGCSCMGSWINGNQNEVVVWVNRGDAAE